MNPYPCPKCSARTAPSSRAGKRRCTPCGWEFDAEAPPEAEPDDEDEDLVPVLGGKVRVAPGRNLPPAPAARKRDTAPGYTYAPAFVATFGASDTADHAPASSSCDSGSTGSDGGSCGGGD